MYDPVPRSHMFMIDARRLSGSGCCSSTQRVQEPVAPLVQQRDRRIINDARNPWNQLMRARYLRVTPGRLRQNYHNDPELNDLLALYNEALGRWLQFANHNHNRLPFHEIEAELERIATQYYNDVRAITNVIQARRHPVINRNNEQAIAMANVINTEQRIEQ